jgi:hypothetical protein
MKATSATLTAAFANASRTPVHTGQLISAERRAAARALSTKSNRFDVQPSSRTPSTQMPSDLLLPTNPMQVGGAQQVEV